MTAPDRAKQIADFIEKIDASAAEREAYSRALQRLGDEALTTLTAKLDAALDAAPAALAAAEELLAQQAEGEPAASVGPPRPRGIPQLERIDAALAGGRRAEAKRLLDAAMSATRKGYGRTHMLAELYQRRSRLAALEGDEATQLALLKHAARIGPRNKAIAAELAEATKRAAASDRAMKTHEG